MPQPTLSRFRFSSAVEVARALNARGARTACDHADPTDDCEECDAASGGPRA